MLREHVWRRARVLIFATVAVLAVLVVSVTSAFGAVVPRASVGGAIAATIPASFLGLSFDFSVLPRIGRYSSTGNLVALLESLGPTGILRFGGGSLDAAAAWSPDGSRPSWASSVVTPADLARLHSLAEQTGWRIVLGVGLGHYTPSLAAQEAAAAQSALGPYLAAFEIGNEPDKFVSQDLRSTGWGLGDYLNEIDTYREAISAAAPGVPIEGPNVTASLDGLTWLAPYAAAESPPVLTAHYYPFTSGGCGTAPTTNDLVSQASVSKEASRFALLSQIANVTGIPVRLSEANDASCGGQPGVSNSFASAIWLTQFLTLSAQAGFSGVNLHDAPSSCIGYSALCTATTADANDGNLTANPKWFALRLFSQLVGTYPVAMSTQGLPPGVSVSGFQASDGMLKLVLINTGVADAESPLVVQLPWRAAGASVMTLTGESLASTSAPTLGDVVAQPTGSLAASQVRPRDLSDASLSLDLPAQSIQIVTVGPNAADPMPHSSAEPLSTTTVASTSVSAASSVPTTLTINVGRARTKVPPRKRTMAPKSPRRGRDTAKAASCHAARVPSGTKKAKARPTTPNCRRTARGGKPARVARNAARSRAEPRKSRPSRRKATKAHR